MRVDGFLLDTLVNAPAPTFPNSEILSKLWLAWLQTSTSQPSIGPHKLGLARH